MIETALDVAGGLLVAVGLATMTIGLLGVLRARGLFLRLHAAGMATGPGLLAVLLGSIATTGATLTRALLVAAFVLLTAPLSSHALARGAHLLRDRESSSSG